MTPEQIAALVAERDALQAEVARLSTPPDDAEVQNVIDMLAETAAIHDADYEATGYFMDKILATEAREVSSFTTRLSHALAAERAKREAMEEALRQYAYAFCEGFCDDMPTMEYTDADCERDCGGCKARATLAKHGSK